MLWLRNIVVLAFLLALFAQPAHAEPVDAKTLTHKVMCGYQGWFRCPGDGTDDGWRHWSRNSRRIEPSTLSFEMWPDLTEFAAAEKFAAPGFSHPDQTPAYLFSSANRPTVERHFRWMEEYGIDGVFLQRFLGETRSSSLNVVLENVRAAAAKSGRTYAICYDLTGAPRDRMQDMLSRDWKRLVDELKVTQDERYLHHGGRPVVFVWGFFSDRFDAELANRLLDIFQADGPYRATVIGGCPWTWRREANADWAKVYRRFDVISPWNVGNAREIDGRKHANTDTWKTDFAEAKRNGKELLPVIYPGFGWTNLQGPQAARQTIPRLGGEFYWRQFVTARELGASMAYVAMFDEVDEGTAIFKVSNTPPTQAKFTTYDGLPSDWYLRLTGEGGKLLRGEREATKELPIKP